MEVSKSMVEKKGNFFLVELVINCLIFAICAAVCLSLFVLGFNDSEESRALSMATLSAQNIAEVIKACDGDEEEIKNHIMMGEKDGVKCVYYNEDWQAVQTQEESEFYALVSIEENNGFVSSFIEVMDEEDNSVYVLEVAKYIDENGGSGNE